MQNEEWIVMLQLIPVEQQSQLVLVLQDGLELTVDMIFRFEPNFLVLRGRVSGTTDEGRAFFVPYERLVYFRIERVVKLEELAELFGETLAARSPKPDSLTAEVTAAQLAVPSAPVDPATVARNALLDRIRAARIATNSTPKTTVNS